MALKVDPPASDWPGVFRSTPGLLGSLREIHASDYGKGAANIADLGPDLLIASGALFRLAGSSEWPESFARDDLGVLAERLTCAAGETLAAMLRFAAADTSITPRPDDWPELVQPRANDPAHHFYWLGRARPLDAYVFSVAERLEGVGRGLATLLESGAAASGAQPFAAAADLLAAAVTLPVALRLDLDHRYPGVRLSSTAILGSVREFSARPASMSPRGYGTVPGGHGGRVRILRDRHRSDDEAACDRPCNCRAGRRDGRARGASAGHDERVGDRNWYLPRALHWLPRVEHDVPAPAPVRA